MKWPSWINVILGVWLIIAPWALMYAHGTAATNSVVVGILVVIFALWAGAAYAGTHGPAWVNVILGIWTIISPWVLGFSAIQAATINGVIFGIAIVVLAAIRVGTPRPLPVGGVPPDRL